MNTSQILAAITPVVEALEQLGVPYHIGGSVASSIYGILRLTIDVDLVADLRLGQVRSLVKRLEAAYYIDKDMILDAIRHRSSFAVIHLEREHGHLTWHRPKVQSSTSLNGIGWAAKYRTASGMISWVFSKSRELISIWPIFSAGQ